MAQNIGFTLTACVVPVFCVKTLLTAGLALAEQAYQSH